MMTWEDLALYIHVNTHEGFLDACKGVPLEHIRECERGLGIALPRLYVDFLIAMGADSGDYHPFGRRYEHNFYALVDSMGDATHPTDRYFRVARDPDVHAETILEPYLDLWREADANTPLITMTGDGLPFEPQYVEELQHTLGEELASIAMLHFGLARPYRRALMAYAEALPDLMRMKSQVMDMLGNLGLKLALAPSPYFSTLDNPELSALVEIGGGGGEKNEVLAVDLAGYDDRQVRRVTEILLDALPDLSEMQTWMPDD